MINWPYLSESEVGSPHGWREPNKKFVENLLCDYA